MKKCKPALALAMMLCLPAIQAGSAEPAASPVPASTVQKAIALWASRDGFPTPTSQSARVDLNDDSIADAVVLLTDPYWCGSGGCTMLVFRGTPEGFVHLSTTALVRAPIMVLRESVHGWHTLSVSMAGGGNPLIQVVVRFDGTAYGAADSTKRAQSEDMEGATTLVMQKD